MPTRVFRYSLFALVFIVAAAFAACGGDYNADDSNLGSGGGLPASDSGDADRAGSFFIQGGGTNESDLPGTLDRKIIRTASLSLAVEDILAGVRQVEDVATSAGGFVSNSSVATDSDDSGPQTATITIRVPADNYTAVLNELRGIAESVRAESSEASEVTEEYTDLQSRLRNLEATEAQYLALLESAQSMDDILAVQDRLNAVRAEIEQVTGRINALDNVTELATINVALLLPASGGSSASQHWATRAWETSWEASKDVAVVFGSVAIGIGVLALWIIPIAIVAFLVWVLFGRRITDLVTRLRGGSSQPPAIHG